MTRSPNRSDPRPQAPAGRRPFRGRFPARRGATMVEFAAVAPLIFLFIFGLFEVGRVLMVLHGLETSAREGCRVAIGYGAKQTAVEAAVTERLATFGIKGYTITTTPNPTGSASQFDEVSVQISVPYSQVSLIPYITEFLELNLKGSCTLPKESDYHVS
jgi:Flp pilus assembly protein TadG